MSSPSIKTTSIVTWATGGVRNLAHFIEYCPEPTDDPAPWMCIPEFLARYYPDALDTIDLLPVDWLRGQEHQLDQHITTRRLRFVVLPRIGVAQLYPVALLQDHFAQLRSGR